MLTIRPEQMRVFEVERVREFCRRVADYLQREFPFATNNLNKNEVLERVNDGLARARRHQFVKEASYVAYIAIEFTVAPHFYRHPAIHKILNDVRIPPDSRMALLAQEITPEQWAEARSIALSETAERKMAALSGSQ